MSERVFFSEVGVAAGVHDRAAVDAGARADVDDPVGGADRVLVVLDDDQRVAEVAQRDERVDEATVVALVQADARLVEHVEHAGEAGADLGRQADALRLAARERGRRAGEVEVAEADVDEEVEPDLDLAQHLRGDRLLAVGELEPIHERPGIGEAQQADVGDAVVVDEHREHLGLQSLAVADGARHLAQVLGPARALHVGLGLQVLPLDVRHDALEAGRVAHLAAVAVAPPHLDLEVVAAEHGVARLVGRAPPTGCRARSRGRGRGRRAASRSSCRGSCPGRSTAG